MKFDYSLLILLNVKKKLKKKASGIISAIKSSRKKTEKTSVSDERNCLFPGDSVRRLPPLLVRPRFDHLPISKRSFLDSNHNFDPNSGNSSDSSISLI